MAFLFNRVNKEELKKRLHDETFKRVTVSFYRYVIIENPDEYRDVLFKRFAEFNSFGRIYIAHEGINAQMSVPEEHWEKFIELNNADSNLGEDLRYNIAYDDDGKSFYKLTIKVREKIVADGLDDNAFDVTNVGNHLSAEEFNEAISDPNAVLVDMRNHYESEIGHFEGAICPDADTFREELPQVLDMLKGQEDKKLVLYCTGGIRCEKASAYFKHHGFQDVNQLQGGIIYYAQEIKRRGVENKFKGKNFVFDERLAETVGHEIISKCHQCGDPCDTHTNCANPECHLLFIQCEKCSKEMEGCCTTRCQDIIHMSLEDQKKLRKGQMPKENALAVYKSRLRPNLGRFNQENSQ